jgi:predicted nicotinamide N-methyase
MCATQAARLSISRHTTTESVTKVRIPGGWSERDVRVGARLLRVVLPADPDAFLDELDRCVEHGAEVTDPYWARLWPCALVMAQQVAWAVWRDAARALELGCGVGLVGLTAATRGCHVTFSDRIPLAVSLALENARRNGSAHVRGMLLDWHEPSSEEFDVILASDVLYDAKQHRVLLRLIQRMLAPEGVCWIGDPGRYHADSFTALARQSGFHVEILSDAGNGQASSPPSHYQLIVLSKSRRV